VDPEVLEVFHREYQSGSEYSTSVPAGFANINVPRGFEIIGSQQHRTSSEVVYKTRSNHEQAARSAVSAMVDAGWIQAFPRLQGFKNGFQLLPEFTTAAVCEDNFDGTLSIIAREISGQTYVWYSARQLRPGQRCAEEEPEYDGYNMAGMRGLVPTLALPKSAKFARRGIGGNGLEVSAWVDIAKSTGQSDLLGFFGNQIEEQDWEFKTSWSSSRSSGSVWERESDEFGLVVGTLQLIDSDTDAIRARFSVAPANPKSSTNHAWSIGWP
jgi:hypothetical protein